MSFPLGVQAGGILRKPEGGKHIRGHGGFHWWNCILHGGVVTNPPGPVEDPDSCTCPGQSAQLLHSGRHTNTPDEAPHLDLLNPCVFVFKGDELPGGWSGDGQRTH